MGHSDLIMYELDGSIFRIFESTPIPLVLSKLDGRLEYVNQAFLDFIGYDRKEIYDQAVCISHPSEQYKNKDIRNQLRKNPFKSITVEKKYVRKDGAVIQALLTIVAQANEMGEVQRYIGQIQDLSLQKRAAEDKALLQHLLDHTGDAIYIVSALDGKIVDSNELGFKRLGYSKEELLSLRACDLNKDYPQGIEWEKYVEKIARNGTIMNRAHHTRKNGSRFPVEGNISFTQYGDGDYLVAIVRDITDRVAQEKVWWRQANYDVLTNIPNRRLFDDRLNQSIEDAARLGASVNLLYIDLDHFKEVNDEFGHDVGDALLVTAADRLQGCVRSSDTIARIGGDEFLVLLKHIRNVNDAIAIAIAQKIISIFDGPLLVKGHSVAVGASIGLATYPKDADNPVELIKKADQALYAAKISGRGRWMSYGSDINLKYMLDSSQVSNLVEAIDNNEFYLVYQPIIHLSTKTTIKAEAFLRWKHPVYGLLHPKQYFPALKGGEGALYLSKWVLQQVVRQVTCWRKLISPEFQIIVNEQLTGYLNNGDKQELLLGNVPGLSFPEGALAIDLNGADDPSLDEILIQKVDALTETGVDLGLDCLACFDASSEGFQKKGVKYLKINASSGASICSNPDYILFCRTIISLAHSLGLYVIAENVEKEEQWKSLESIGCDYSQGFFFSRPVETSAFEAFVNEYQ